MYVHDKKKNLQDVSCDEDIRVHFILLHNQLPKSNDFHILQYKMVLVVLQIYKLQQKIMYFIHSNTCNNLTLLHFFPSYSSPQMDLKIQLALVT